jgi:hypothetical protein
MAKLFRTKGVWRLGEVAFAVAFGYWSSLLVALTLLHFGAAYLLVLLPGALLVGFVTLAVHETGHLIAALVARLRVVAFAVGPVAVVRSKGGLVVEFLAPRMWQSGLTLALPTGVHSLRRRMALFIVGGPLASLVVGGACLVLAYHLNEATFPFAPYLPRPFWDRALFPRTHAFTWFNLAALLNLLLVGIGNLLPWEYRHWASDGAKLQELLRDGRRWESTWLIEALRASLLDGIRPRDWNPALVERLLALRTGSSGDVTANLYGHYYSLDVGRLDQAGQLLDLAVTQREGTPAAQQPAVLVESAFFEARYRHNAVAARRRLEQVPRDSRELHTYLRAESALLLAEGRAAEAAAAAEAGLAALPQSKDPGGALAEGELLAGILRDSRSRVAPDSPPPGTASP